ncbi:PASTA domain-containing protein [Bacteroides reticulotermitis]|uniref:PASTA domain-containing protein n=1 Tax=Bacteroides reticulotermitis TaxID=1133319 RepID=UPI003A8C51D6
MSIKDFFSFKTNKFFWINIIAMVIVVIGLLFVTLKGLDVYTRHGEAVVVPDVKGMTVDEATRMFRNHGINCVVSDSNYVKNKSAGIILELSPAAGQKVKEGRVIYLTINTLNIPLRPIPDVADNSSVRQAQAKILAAGFKLGEMQTVSGEKDWVYGVKYQGRQLMAGDKVPLGASLTLMIGNGTTEFLEEDSVDTSATNEKPVASETATEDNSWF